MRWIGRFGAAVASAAAFAAVAVPGAANAANRGGAGVLVYSGTSTTTSLGSGGSSSTNPIRITVECGDGSCSVRGVPGLTGDTTLRGTGLSVSTPASGSLCDNTYEAARSTTVQVSETTLTAVFRLEGSGGPEDCGGGDSIESFGVETTVTATLLSGDFCVVRGDCPQGPGGGDPRGGDRGAAGSPSTPRAGLPADAPSAFSSLPTAAEALTGRNVLLAAAMTVVLVLLVAFPTSLLNSASEAATERWDAWRESRRRAGAPAREPRRGWRGWPFAAGGVLVAGVISAFVEPDLGLDAGSLRVLASVLVSFGLEVVAGWLVVVWLVRRRRPEAEPTFSFAPVSLLVVVAAVAFSRLTGFEPGIVFGLVAGVGFATLTSVRDTARVTLTALGWAFALAVLGWLAYSALGRDGEGGGVLFARETLSAMAVTGMAALPLTLIPVKGMPGHAVFAWDRRVWTVSYAVGLASFFLVLLPMPASWDSVPLELWTWIGLYVAYAVAAVAIWAILTRPWEADDGRPLPVEEPVGR